MVVLEDTDLLHKDLVPLRNQKLLGVGEFHLVVLVYQVLQVRVRTDTVVDYQVFSQLHYQAAHQLLL